MEKTIRDQFCFTGQNAEKSAQYYDIVISHGYKGDITYLAWDAAHKFGTRMTSENLASFRAGITIGSKALEAAEFLDDERQIAYASCEEFNRRKQMEKLMSVVYDEAKRIFGVQIKFL